jgi:HlyD family secretion protein
VASSLKAPTILTIAQYLSKMLVYTKTDESDVGNIKPGKQVTFKVDAFPKETFRGSVAQVRMNPTIVQNVVTYDTMIEFDNPDLKLFPGMTAYVTIPVASVQNALKLPNTALRYKPLMSPEEILRLYQQYGIDEKETEATTQSSQAAGTTESNITRVPRATRAVVWSLFANNTLEPVEVSLGITDHAFTEVKAVLKGSLKEGDNVVVRSISSKPAAPGTVRR